VVSTARISMTGQSTQTLQERITTLESANRRQARRLELLERIWQTIPDVLQQDNLVYGEVLTRFLQVLGESIGADRVSVFENETAPDGSLCMCERYTWDNRAETTLPIHCYSYAGLDRWVAELSHGHAIHGSVDSCPATEQQFLRQFGMQSFLIVPIFDHNHSWWGYIGFDDCARQRTWETAAIDILRMAAEIFRTLLRQGHHEAERARHLALAQAAVESATGGVLVSLLDGSVFTYNQRLIDLWAMPASGDDPADFSTWCHHMAQQTAEPDEFFARIATIVETADESYDLISLLDGRTMERYSRPYRVQGIVAGQLWSFRDVTWRVVMEASARQSMECELSTAERKVEEQQAVLTTFLDQANLYAFVKDVAGTIIYLNQPLADLFGVNRQAAIGAPQEEVFPDHVASWRAHDEQMIWGQQPWTGEESVVTSTGEKRIFLVTKTPVVDACGRIQFLCGMATDITERKQTEKALQSSEGRLRAIYEHAAIGVGIVRMDGTIVQVNTTFADFVGYEPHELTGMSWQTLGEPEDIARHMRVRQEALDTGASHYSIEKRYRRKDKSIRWGRLTASWFYDEEQETKLGIGMVEDITDRKHMEITIQEQAHQYCSVVQSLHEGVVVLDSHGAIQTYNVRAWHILRTNEDMLPHHALLTGGTGIWDEQGHPISQDQHPLRIVQQTKLPSLRHAMIIANANEDHIWIRVNVIPIMSDDDTMQAIVMSFTDITERKRLDAQLRQTNHKLEQRVQERTTELRESLRKLEEHQALLNGFMTHAPTSMFVKDQNGRYMMANGRVATRKGHDPDSLVGLTDTDIFSPAVSYQIQRHDQLVWETTRAHDFEETVDISPETTLVFLVTKFPIWNSAGTMIALGGVATDVTERVEATRRLHEVQAVLHRTRALLQSFLDFSPVALYAKDLHGRHVLVNQFIAQSFGLNPEEIVGKTDEEVYARQGMRDMVNLANSAAHEQEVIDRQEPVVREVSHPHLGSVPRVYLDTKFPIYDDTGRIVGIGGVAVDITERRQAEADLAASRDLLQGFIDYLPAAVYVKDMERRFILLNQRAAAYAGYTKEEMLYRPDRDLFPPDVIELWEAYDRTMLEDDHDPVKQEEHFLIRGTPMIFETVRFTLRDVHRQRYAIAGVVTDITDRKRAEEALAISEERYRILVETSPDSILVTDAQNRIIFCNQQTLAMFEYCDDDLIGQPGDVLLEGDADLLFAQMDASRLQAGDVRNLEYRMRSRTGRVFSAEINCSLLMDDQSQLHAIILVIRDITDRKQAEEGLRANRNVLLGLIDALEDGLLLLEEDGTIRAINRALANLFNTRPEAMVGKNWFVEFPKFDVPFPGELARASATPIVHHDPVRFSSDQRTRVLTIQTFSLVDPKQTILHVRDDTEQLTLQARTMEAERFAAAGRLAATVAHELHSPLQAIKTSLKVLINRPDTVTEATRLELFNGALSESYRMTRIIRRLLDLTAPDKRENAETPVVVLTTLMERLKLLHNAQARKQGVHVTSEAPLDLPLVEGPSDDLMQVLTNLFMNALDAMPHSGTIHLRAFQHDICVGCAITDSGPGIPPAVQERIFDAFFTTKENGTGLGLSISQQIIGQRHGRLFIEDTGPHGTTVCFLIPAIHEPGECPLPDDDGLGCNS